MRLLKLTAVCAFLLLLPLTGCVIHPLAEAISNNDPNTVTALLDKGASPNSDSPFVMAPLSSAAWLGHIEIVKILLDRGADPNEYLGDTPPMHYAATRGRADIVKLLLDHGARASNKDYSGKSTAADWAAKNGHVQLAQLLRDVEARESGRLPASSLAQQVVPVPADTASPLAVLSDIDRVPLDRMASKKNAYAIVIGIEQYREKLPKADFADRDAKLVGDYLTKVLGYPEENVVVRTNDKASLTDLIKYFENWLPNNVEKNSSVFVYYSGHGAPNPKTGDAYMVPYDGDPTFVDATGYPMKRLYAALDKLQVKDITVVLDSCFSGAGGRSVLAKGTKPMGLSVEHTLAASGKTTVLAASAGDQISSAYEEKGHGLLTYFFLKGLHGEGDLNKDGIIDMAELYDYVKPNVSKVARKQYNNEQTPQLIGSPDSLRKGGNRLIERSAP